MTLKRFYSNFKFTILQANLFFQSNTVYPNISIFPWLESSGREKLTRITNICMRDSFFLFCRNLRSVTFYLVGKTIRERTKILKMVKLVKGWISKIFLWLVGPNHGGSLITEFGPSLFSVCWRPCVTYEKACKI